VLTVKRVKGGTRIGYDTQEWRRRCRHIALDSPILCLLQKADDDDAGSAN
jgi:hypothetical protein